MKTLNKHTSTHWDALNALLEKKGRRGWTKVDKRPNSHPCGDIGLPFTRREDDTHEAIVFLREIEEEVLTPKENIQSIDFLCQEIKDILIKHLCKDDE